MGREPWSSGYGRRLVFGRSWVWIPAPYTGWTWHFSHLFALKFLLFVWKDKNKWKRGRGWPIFLKNKCWESVSRERRKWEREREDCECKTTFYFIYGFLFPVKKSAFAIVVSSGSSVHCKNVLRKKKKATNDPNGQCCKRCWGGNLDFLKNN